MSGLGWLLSEWVSPVAASAASPFSQVQVKARTGGGCPLAPGQECLVLKTYSVEGEGERQGTEGFRRPLYKPRVQVCWTARLQFLLSESQQESGQEGEQREGEGKEAYGETVSWKVPWFVQVPCLGNKDHQRVMEGGSHVSDTQPDTHPPVAIRREKCHGAQDTLHFRDKKTWREAEVFLEANAALCSHPLSLRAAIFPIPQDRQKQRATVWPPMRPQPG